MHVYICIWSKGCLGGAKDMTQQVRVLATKHEDPRSIPGTHAVEGGNSFHNLSSDLHMQARHIRAHKSRQSVTRL